MPSMQSSATSRSSMPSSSQPRRITSRSHLAANFLSLNFFSTLLTSRSSSPWGRIRAQAWMMPVSSSTVKRLFSRFVSGLTSLQRPQPWLKMARTSSSDTPAASSGSFVCCRCSSGNFS